MALGVRYRRLVAAAALLASASAAPGQVRAWLEWADSEFPGTLGGWIEIVGYQQGMGVGLSTPPEPGVPIPPPQVSAVTIQMRAGPLAPRIFQTLANGTNLSRLRLHLVVPGAGPTPLVAFEVAWNDVWIQSAELAVASDAPLLTFAFTGARQAYRTTAILPDGSSDGIWETTYDLEEAISTVSRNGTNLVPGAYHDDSPPPIDGDGDGLPDSWERDNGLDPNVRGDADLDPDGDGLSSRLEYLAGTNPRQATSRLSLGLDPMTEEGGFRIMVAVGGGRRVELRRSSTPGADRETGGEVVGVIEESFGGNDDGFFVSFADADRVFDWIRVTLP